MSPKDNFDDIMEAARQMQKSMEVAQEQLNLREETGVAGSGLVKVTMNGHHVPTKVSLNDSLQNKDMRTIEELVLAAIKDAVQKVDKTSQETIMKLTQGIGLPSEMELLEESEE